MIKPIYYAKIENNLSSSKMIYTSPKGKTINQDMLYDLSQEEEITILVGRYEGVDQRVLDKYEFEEVSVGDFVLTGGDLVAQIIVDGVSRLLPGVLNNKQSIIADTFTQDLLEHPQYTRPEIYDGMEVPEVLLSGHHKNIENWKLEQQIKETKSKRKDLYDKYKRKNK